MLRAAKWPALVDSRKVGGVQADYEGSHDPKRRCHMRVPFHVRIAIPLCIALLLLNGANAVAGNPEDWPKSLELLKPLYRSVSFAEID